jgi:biopolymer transport protein TolR
MKNESVSLQSEINITPLVDVVLVLLIIFMVMSPFSLREYEVAIPSPAIPSLKIPSIPITVDQLDENTVYLNQEFVPMRLLAHRLQDTIAKHPKGTVLYSGKDELTYGTAIQTLDLIRNSGAERIGIVRGQK